MIHRVRMHVHMRMTITVGIQKVGHAVAVLVAKTLESVWYRVTVRVQVLVVGDRVL
jgi:hypothetical protein